jgi:hypothetical protein
MKFNSYPSVNKFLAPVLVMVALIGSYVVAQATGFWAVSGKEMIDLGNMTSSADIRGWMTLDQVILGFGIQQNEFYELLGIPADIPATTALKDLEGLIDGFEVTSVREAVDAIISSSSLRPEQAPVIASPEPTPTPVITTEPAEPSSHLPQGSGVGEGTITGLGPTPLPPGQTLPATEIKGRHTLQQIADQCQIPLTDLIEALGLPDGIDADIAVKDLVESGEVNEIQVVRDVVTTLQKK